ncbi:glycosyltransferase [Desulfohalovibrio reitneri]|uniref:glycosyltransferase n=1 Tax=Desulfohalovibrio reitneri TaxID=1307759 RepID=UPI0004A6FB50|nr:glycosyltransferase [Desulfohalovibrio reitneri]
MSYLIFCSFEVGGFPYKMAELLNRLGHETFYVSVDAIASGHDSTRYHYDVGDVLWDLSGRFAHTLDSRPGIRKQLRELAGELDIKGCLATGNLSYLLAEAGIPYHYWTYGSDLDQNCFDPVHHPSIPAWKWPLLRLGFRFRTRRRQRRSYRLASRVMFAPHQKPMALDVFPGRELFFLPHFLTPMPYEQLAEFKRRAKAEICAKLGCDRYVFSATRHEWAGFLKEYKDNKRNDVLIRAFERFVRLAPEQDTRLVLVEKGNDVEESRRLIEELGIAGRVVWVKPMPRGELDEYYAGADFCLAQFGTPVFSFAVLEPLANATPCVSHTDSANDVPIYKSFPPIHNSVDPEDIARYMAETLATPGKRDALGREAWQWIVDNCSEEVFAASFTNMFQSPPKGILRP